MKTIPYSLEELSSIHSLYIPEQGLEISLNSNFSFFDVNDNMVVIIGYATDHTLSNHAGKLMCGVLEIKKILSKDQEFFIQRLVLPFSSKVLYAKFDKEAECFTVMFKEDEKLVKKTINIRNGVIPYEEYASLLGDDYPLIMPVGELHMIQGTPKVLAKSL